MDGPTRPELMTARAEATGDAARQAADAEALLFGASARGDVEGLRALIVGGAELEAKEAMRAVHTRCSQRQHSRRAAEPAELAGGHSGARERAPRLWAGCSSRSWLLTSHVRASQALPRPRKRA
jgi:hypothetical protein